MTASSCAILNPSFASLLAAKRKSDTNGYKVLLISIDDVGRKKYLEWSAAGLTPELDLLTPDALDYVNFQAAPRCGVLRCTKFVGAEPHALSNLGGRNCVWADTWPGPAGTWIGEGMPGYRVIIGKLHVMGSASYPDTVLRGCDEFHGCHAQLDTQEGTPQKNFSHYQWWETSILTGQSKTIQLHSNEFNTNVLNARAIDAINNGTEFIDLNYHSVHLPLNPPPPDDEPIGVQYVGGATFEEKAREYMRHLSFRAAELIAYARAAGYVVILYGDNGPLGEGKGTTSQRGLNTPCFVWAPGLVGRQSTRLVGAQDIWATVRELRGASLHVSQGGSVTLGGEHSWSFVDDIFPTVFGPRPQRTYLRIDEFPKIGAQPDSTDWVRVVRNAQYKLIVDNDPVTGNVTKFFDLLADPDEVNNLFGTAMTIEQQRAFDRLQLKLPTVP